MSFHNIDKVEIAGVVEEFKKSGNNHVNIACKWEDVEKFRELLVEEGYKFYLPEYKTRMIDTYPYATIYFKERM